MHIISRQWHGRLGVYTNGHESVFLKNKKERNAPAFFFVILASG
jgi:hypothetical protein